MRCMWSVCGRDGERERWGEGEMGCSRCDVLRGLIGARAGRKEDG